MTAIALLVTDDAHLLGELAAAAKAAGAATIHAFDAAGLPDQDSATYAAAAADAAKKANATLVVVSATKRGKDIGPRVAALLDAPFAAEAQALRTDAALGGLVVERMVLSGNSRATYSLGARGVVTVMPKTFEADAAAGAAAAAAKVAGTAPASKVQLVAKKEAAHSDFDLSAAPVVIGVGRGFKAQADIALAEKLAKCFPGGAVGCSRPIAADLKWLGEEHWIGLSGHAIKPKAYIACGVSGQIQHIAGIRGSKLIIAINTNKDAPIFGVCDYGIVGDLYQVIPKLTQLLGK